MASAPDPEDGRELYALLHLSPDASSEEIRRAYRQFAQIYHPDKYQDPQMKEVATENFQRICDAYEILSDENKRQIYDIYGMEGLNSGLELGPKLTKPEEIKEQLERLRRRKEEENFFTHALPNGSIIANFSVPQYLNGGGIMRGYKQGLENLVRKLATERWESAMTAYSLPLTMAMSSEVELPVSKQNAVVVDGNLVVNDSAGTGAASTVLRHQLSPVSSIEFMATAGLRSVIGTQMFRQISPHSTATSGLAVSLRDGSINLSNAWTRQLSDNAVGNIQLVLGDESSISVGWQKKDEKSTATGEVKFGTNFFGASAHYTHRFSSKSHARIAGRVGSTALDFEIGGGRRISKFSTVRMMYNIGIQGISWRFELHRAGQKLIVPVLLSTDLNALFVTSAFAIPSTLYFLLQTYVVKPYYLKREKQKTLEKMEDLSTQLTEARKAAEKAQKLLEPVSNRKKNRQLESNGLVITKALYGSRKKIKESSELNEIHNDMASQVFDVTIPLNFLVTEAGQLKLHDGIKKSGIMGFYDPCPGDPKLLVVEYTCHGRKYKVMVDDYEALLIPQDIHQL